MERSRQCTPLLGMLIVACLAGLRQAPAQLPNDAGQTWKTYDLEPFVKTAGAGSERHVVEWILQETGYPAWHGTIPASLSAGDGKLSCYHTPEMQAQVAEIVERFVAEAEAPHRFTVRVFGVDGPGWRAKARPALQPIPTATPGVQAWIVPRETAAVVLANLRGRSDVAELPTGPALAANGLPASLKGGRQQAYVEDYAQTPNAWPGWQPKQATCDEGLAIDLHPLVSRDGTAVEAAFRCRIDQIERMAPVVVSVPVADQQRAQIEVPQMSAVRVGERFRWPVNQTLVVGLGLVPWPVPGQNAAGTPALFSDAKRTDVVVVVEPRLTGGP